MHQSEVTEQIWKNMQRNCDFTETLSVHPALNQSGPPEPEYDQSPGRLSHVKANVLVVVHR